MAMRNFLDSAHVVIAIDPGLSGAAARIGQGILEVRRDFKTLADIVRAVQQLNGDNLPQHFIIEQVGARPGQGVCSMFSFGKATGVAFGAVYSTGHNVEEVHPLRWQNFFRRELGISKEIQFDSREIAGKLLPDRLELFKRKKDHNTADAVLIGLYKLAQFA